MIDVWMYQPHPYALLLPALTPDEKGRRRDLPAPPDHRKVPALLDRIPGVAPGEHQPLDLDAWVASELDELTTTAYPKCGIVIDRTVRSAS